MAFDVRRVPSVGQTVKDFDRVGTRAYEAARDNLKGQGCKGAGKRLGGSVNPTRDAMGMGDVKLALLLGTVVGCKVFGAIVVGSIAMLPFALLMAVREGSINGATLPFGRSLPSAPC